MSIKEPRKFVPTDQGHADVLNIPITTLYENDRELAAQVESIRSDPAGNGVVPKEAFDQYKQETQTQINTALQTAKDYTRDYAAPKSHTHLASDLPSASTQARGIVQLNTSTSSTATDQAATPSAVKAAYEAANAANLAAAAAENNAKNASMPRATRVIGDLNSVIENGFYDGYSMANAPSTEWYYVEHISHSQNPGAWRLQRATNFYDGVTYWRQMRNAVWTAWQIFGGGGVKKVTRYSVTLNSSTTDDYGTVTVTIPAVDVNKTSINLTGFYTRNHVADDTSPDRKTAAVYLVNATTVIVRTSSKIITGTYGRALDAYFEVIEYN
ncbi:pyocin knob domain-containing protein [Paenibacillus kribbensis]|uniref:pyocin knob domain-containing protein n=1 Tax=Paenibacillus kribbensis TaxID=172713 RepID=UPI0015B7D56B|nr:pyocin knob domain-containing protein [Paenibacillus kribbensis]